MKVRLKFDTPADSNSRKVKKLIEGSRLSTVCEEASCPNLGHCWGQGTATFLVMGEVCTRRCGFCDISTARPFALDPSEPLRLADTIAEMELKHAVITSVDRDDLKDCGSMHFARCITATREKNPNTSIEVLIPDFKGKLENLQRIWDAGPDIINHNVETVPSLFSTICPQSNYQVSLDVLRESAERGFLTKSGIILGLGETLEEVRSVLDDLRQNGVHLVTIGQYMQPTREHAPLVRYAPVSEFQGLKEYALELGFLHVESGPLVRSSYHAGDALETILKRGAEPKIG
ncbi:MAG: lipoyl synthase [Leptospiraceae bacterium]|nr:lipoyl synthase [Leptospiraceae bacterium]